MQYDGVSPELASGSLDRRPTEAETAEGSLRP